MKKYRTASCIFDLQPAHMVTKDLAYEQIEQLGARFHEQFQFVIQ